MNQLSKTESLSEEERKEYRRLQKKIGCKFGSEELGAKKMEIEVIFRVDDFRANGEKIREFTYPLVGVIPEEHKEKICEELKEFCEETFSEFKENIVELFKKM